MPPPPPLAAAFRLRLITAQRRGEVHNMGWADVDLESACWTIPGAHAKNGLPHRVPLTHPAVTILRALQTAKKSTAVYVLAGTRWKRQRAAAQSRMGLTDFRGHDQPGWRFAPQYWTTPHQNIVSPRVSTSSLDLNVSLPSSSISYRVRAAGTVSKRPWVRILSVSET